MALKAFLARLNRKDTHILPRVPKTTKYALAIFCLISAIFLTNNVLAQTFPARNELRYNVDAWKAKTNVQTWTAQESLPSILMGLLDMLTDFKNAPDSVIDADPSAGQTSWVPGGAIGGTAQIASALYTPPASGIEYMASIKDNLLGKPAYAQGSGVGYLGLQPLLPVWKGFRNVVYILSSLFFIIIAIMIILRVKISPQAVISIQNAIPQLITTLILVTFSYAIAGLLIDATYIVQGIAISTLFSATGTGATQGILKANIGHQFASWVTQIFGGNYTAYNMEDLMYHNGFIQTFDLTGRLLPLSFLTIFSAILGAVIGGLIGGGFNPATAALGGVALPAILLLVFAIIIIIKLISFLFALIKVYLTVLIDIILAPLMIGMGAFPGSKTGFSTWFWDLVANLAVFPFTMIFLVFANMIVERVQAGGLWAPGIMGISGAQGTYAGQVIAALVGIGAFILLSKLPDMIPQVIFSLKPSPWGTAIGQTLDKNVGTGRGMAGSIIGGSVSSGAGRWGQSAYDLIEPLNSPNAKGSLQKTIGDYLNRTISGK